MEKMEIQHIDKETLFPPNSEKISFRNEIINQNIFHLGIEKNEKIIHFGCGSRQNSFLNYIKDKNVNYTGVDSEKSVIEKCESIFSDNNFIFKHQTIQSFIDEIFETDSQYDWCIIDGLLDKNLYEERQYEYLDEIVRKSLIMSKLGLIIVFESNHTKNDDSYNSDFITAYLGSLYKRYTFIRLNQNQYIYSLYKFYI